MKNSLEILHMLGKCSLDDILLAYDIVLADTSALISPLNLNHGKNERVRYQSALDSAVFFEPYFRNGRIYVTQKIFDEYSSYSILPLKKRIIRGGSGIKREDLDIMRLREKERKARNRLVRSIEDGRIIHLSENDKNSYGKSEIQIGFCREVAKLSDSDRDLLIHSMILQKKNSVALLSNDFAMQDVWTDYLKFSGTYKSQFGFFLRLFTGKANYFRLEFRAKT